VLVVRSTNVVLPEGVRPASIVIVGEAIERIDAYGADDAERVRGATVLDAGDLVVSPGVVDTHVHVNEPGRTEWEGFDTATRAAAAGGVTTIVDMPLNSVPATTNVEALRAKTGAAAGAHVDVAFWGGIVPGNQNDLDGLTDAGVRGFKCFLVPSGVPEFQPVTERDLRGALPILARRRVPLLVHAESPTVIDECARMSAERPPRSYAAYLASRPAEAEVDAVALMVRLAAEFRVHVHVVHVSSAGAVAAVARAKASGVPITAETCPHYLTFASGDIPDGATEFKCAPPIRDAAHRDALWAGLQRGTLDLVASDHSPAPPALKCADDFARAWGGIASLELSLSAVWTAGCPRGATFADLARWLSEGPAALAGLSARKGRLAAGLDADLVVWDPAGSFVVEPSLLQQRHTVTPYRGRRLSGRVQTTFVRGARVWDDRTLVGPRTGRRL
jgi:allantoinase